MKLIAAALAVMLAGCATPNRGSGAAYAPIVDRPGPDYLVDLNECQQHATKVMDAASAGANGAIAGALVGGLIGAAFGLRGQNLSGLATVGAVSGGSRAAVDAEGGQRGIITRCMVGRGYNVIG